MRSKYFLPAVFGSASLFAIQAQGHSVAQVQTAKRIAEATVVALDPQGNPVSGGTTGSDTTAKVGDILTFVIQFTPLPNNATRGAGGYITEYVPGNMEVVGARIVDKDGNTVRPKRGPQMNDGFGPKNRHDQFDGMGLDQGSMSQVYADTGIFFSTDPRTARNPGDAFLTVQNGLAISPEPTGAKQLDDFLGFEGPPFFAHNQWDLAQTLAFGVKDGPLLLDGRGNTPYGYGSAVAGPQTHYQNEKVVTPACSDGVGVDYPGAGCASALDDDETGGVDAPVGPWRRIKYWGSEIGTGGPTDCDNCAGAAPVRVGVPTDLGVELSADSPLPADTNAVRFAVGELVVGEEYFAEVSFRVKGLPLDPIMGADVNCAEVFGGDAAQPQNGQDNTWRYYVPSPACVQLNLVFELTVNKLLAVQGDSLVYTIRGKNLSTSAQTNVVVTDTYVANDVAFGSVLAGPAPVQGNGLLTWPTMSLGPGVEYTYQWDMTVTGDNLSTLNRATYTSDALPAPGFSVVALTDIHPIVVMAHQASVATTPGTAPPSTSAGGQVHYTVTVVNNGTEDATADNASFVNVTLPADFSFCPAGGGCAAAQINGADVADPAVVGSTLSFAARLPGVPKSGGTLVLDFDVTVGAGATPGAHSIDVQTQFDDNGVGRNVENSTFDLAELLVDAVRSDTPTIDEPVLAGQTSVGGTTSEGPGARVTVFVNGNPAPAVVAGAGGGFIAAVPTLYAGQRLSATAENTAASELESPRLDPEVVVGGVSGVAACSDGEDNDGDGQTDFPDDPGCEDENDPDETDIPQCSDGVDNDGDGDTDYPDDSSCSSFVDDDESGASECSDGVDNDGDGSTDFPDDPGCESADDGNETTVPACANGKDDDSDGLIDYPEDPGCSSAVDSDEIEGPGDAGPDASSGASGAGGAGGGAGAASGGQGQGSPPDRGGVVAGADSGDDGGCGCRTAASDDSTLPLGFGALVLGFAWGRRRRGVRARIPPV